MSRLLCIAIGIFALVFPTQLRADTSNWQLALGLGAVHGNCEFSEALGRDVCLKGSRVSLGLGIQTYGKQGADAPFRGGDGSMHASSSSAKGDSARASSSCDWGRGCNPGSGCNVGGGGGKGCGEAAVAIIVIALVALILYGIWFALVTAFADGVKFSLAYSNDFQADDPLAVKDWYEAYHVQRYGVQTGLYMIPAVDLQIHATASYSVARIDRKTVDAAVDADDASPSDTYHLQGFSSALGIGWVPRAYEKGPFALVELESNFFNETSLRAYVKEKQKSPVPTSRQSAALVVGYAF